MASIMSDMSEIEDMSDLCLKSIKAKSFKCRGLFCLAVAPDIPCGYVRVTELLEEGIASEDELNAVDAYGGITFECGKLTRYGFEGTWVGFDMGHCDDMNIVDVPVTCGSFAGIELKGHAPAYKSTRTIDEVVHYLVELACNIDELVKDREPGFVQPVNV